MEEDGKVGREETKSRGTREKKSGRRWRRGKRSGR